MRIFLLACAALLLTTPFGFAESYKSGWLVSVKKSGESIFLASFTQKKVSPFKTTGHEKFYSARHRTDYKLEGILKVKEVGNYVFQIRVTGKDEITAHGCKRNGTANLR